MPEQPPTPDELTLWRRMADQPMLHDDAAEWRAIARRLLAYLDHLGVHGQRRAAGEAEAVEVVVEHYRKHKPRALRGGARPGSVEWKRITDALRAGLSVETMCDAIDGCMIHPYNCGDNDRKVTYQSLELILRNTAQIHRFADFYHEQLAKQRHRGDAYRSW